MKFISVDSHYEVDLDLDISGYADDDEWTKDVRVSLKVEGAISTAKFEFLAYLRDGKVDEISEFIKELHVLNDRREGKAELRLAGAEQENFNERTLILSLYSIDSVGHIAIEVTLSGSTRYSNAVNLPIGFTVTFEIDPGTIEEAASRIETLYDGVNINA